MSIKQIYNPPKVYEGWFESYFIKPWFRHYADFGSGESSRDCWRSLLAWAIVTMGFAGLLMGLVGLLGPEVGFICMISVGGAWILFSIIPFIALLARTFNGVKAEPRTPRRLGIDVLMLVICLLFFVFGLLMMTTTLHSETLHFDYGTDPEEETVAETDTVTEEALFTYQNAPVDTTTVVVDTLSDLTEPDMVDPNESYDPTIEDNAGPDAPVQPADTTTYF